MIKQSAIVAVALGGLALAGCNKDQVISMVADVANAGPQTCADLQSITGSISGYAGQVQAANVSDPKVAAVVAKINAHEGLANKDCATLAAAAPKVVEILKAGADVLGGFKF